MRIRLSLVALAGATSMASAADLPVRTDPPAPAPVSAPLFTNMAADWTGGYVGATANVIRPPDLMFVKLAFKKLV